MGKQIFIRRILPFILVPMAGFSLMSLKDKNPKFDELVVIHTRFGEVHAVLYDETPEHKENFLKLLPP